MLRRKKREVLLKNSRGAYKYQFNWVQGGFNDIWAMNLKEFKTEVKRQFANTTLDVDYTTLHKATASSSESWDMAGNMSIW